MPFVTRNPGDQAMSRDVDQFIWALTGLLPDQAIVLGQQVTVQGRSLYTTAMTSPTIASSALTGAGGGTAATYSIAARTVDGAAIPGPGFAVAAANMPLAPSGTNYITLTFPVAIGSSTYDVLKGGLLLTTVTAISGSNANLTVKDIGQTTSAYTAATAAIGGVVVQRGLAAANASGSGNIGGAGAGATYPGVSAPMIVQGGSIAAGTGAGGGVQVTYPVPFPNGVMTAMGTNGDNSVGSYTFHISPTLGSPSLSLSPYFYVYNLAGALVVNTTVRMNWIALGW